MSEQDDHHRRFSDDKLEAFYRDYVAHTSNEETMFDEVVQQGKINALQNKENMDQIAELTQAVERQTTATQGLIEAWNNAQGFVKVVKWLGGFSLSAWLLAELAKHFK